METPRYDAIATWYDELRNSPSFIDDIIFPHLLRLLGDIKQKSICDLACGQGIVSRLLAQQGAQVTGVDISTKLLALAQQYEERHLLGIRYIEDNAHSLAELETQSFERVVSHLALMDIPDLAQTFQAVYRVLKPSGYFVFSITHPCFESPHAKWIEESEGNIKREIGAYFEEGFWRSDNPNGVRGKVGAHHRMLSTYLNLLLQAGFSLSEVAEPQAMKGQVKRVPGYAVVPAFMVVQAQK